MEFAKEGNISGARVKVVAALHPSSQPDNMLKLITRGDTNHMMTSMDWFKKRRLKPESFAQYLLLKIVEAVFASLKSNRRLITSPNMEVHVQVDPPARFSGAPADSSFDALAEYNSHLSGPSYAFISFFPTNVFFAIFMKGEGVLRRTMLHEMQHHGDMGYGRITAMIASRAHELHESSRLSYNGWIAIAALLELKNEGLPTFSEWANAGSYLLSFSEMKKFVNMFLAIPPATHTFLNNMYGFIKQSAYNAGLTMFVTILAQRLSMKKITSYMQPVGEKNFEPLKNLKDYYGVRDVYILCPSQQKHMLLIELTTALSEVRAQNEAKRLIEEMQGKSHLYFLSAYEEACRYLGVKPLISREVYVKVKLECHLKFLHELQASGISATVA